MNRREAKRQVCLELGRRAFQLAECEPTVDADGARLKEATLDLAAELLRRGGAETEAAQVDERQLTIEQAIEEAEAR